MAKFRYRNTYSCYMCPKYFLKIAGKLNNYLFYLYNFVKFWDNISHKLLRPSQFLENLQKFRNDPLYRNKSSPFLLLNVTAYWQSSNSEACAKKLPQIVANNVDNGGRGIGLKVYVRFDDYLHWQKCHTLSLLF